MKFPFDFVYLGHATKALEKAIFGNESKFQKKRFYVFEMLSNWKFLKFFSEFALRCFIINESFSKFHFISIFESKNPVSIWKFTIKVLQLLLIVVSPITIYHYAS